VLISGKGAFCLLSFHNLYDLDRQAQSNQQVCHNWKLQDQSLIVRRGSGFVFFQDFAVACDNAGMKISAAKSEVLHLSRNPNPDQYPLQASGASLKQVEKFKYLEVVFASDGRQNEELDT